MPPNAVAHIVAEGLNELLAELPEFMMKSVKAMLTARVIREHGNVEEMYDSICDRFESGEAFKNSLITRRAVYQLTLDNINDRLD